MLTTEWVTAALLVLIYLADCVVLLHRGQGLLEWGLTGWSIKFGARYYTIRDRPVAMLSVLAPWRPAFKTGTLLPQQSSAKVVEALRTLSGAVRIFPTVGVLASVQAVIVLGAIPAFLLKRADIPLLVALGLAYVNALTMVGLILTSTATFRQPHRALLGLSATCLLCLPLSVNFPRRTTLQMSIPIGARRSLGLVKGLRRESARFALAGQIDEVIAELDNDDANRSDICRLRDELFVRVAA